MLIAEMLLLTALNDKGHVPVGSGALIQVGLTGALLADLAIDGRLAVAEDGTVRAGDTRPGDELLADVDDAVREHLQGRNVRHVIGGLSHRIGGSWDRVAGRLIDAGVLGRDRPSLLRPTRYPVLDTAARQAVLDQIRAAAAGEGPVSPQVAVVLALIGPCRLLERVAPDPGTRGEAKRRIDRVTAETPLAPGVATIIDELIVAINVTATTVPPSFAFLAAGSTSPRFPVLRISREHETFRMNGWEAEMTFSNIASLVVSVISAVVATAAFVATRLDPKPKIRGQINTILHSPLSLPDGREITALMLHVTLTNSTKNPAHVMSYRLEIDRGHGREQLSRLKRMYALPALTAGDQRIILDQDVLIYRPPRPVEYGAPLVGLIIFYLEEPGVSEEIIKEYELTVTDVLGNRHRISYRRGELPPEGFDSVELFELAGARIEQLSS